MPLEYACCNACCPIALPALSASASRSSPFWPGVLAFGLLLAGTVLTGRLVLVEVARALAAARAP